MQTTDFSNKLLLLGHTDERAAVVIGKISSPGLYGMVLACVNKDVLRILDTDMSSRIGRVLLEFPLKKIEIEKARSFVLAPKLRFTYKGMHYELTNFNCAKEFIPIVLEENKKEKE